MAHNWWWRDAKCLTAIPLFKLTKSWTAWSMANIKSRSSSPWLLPKSKKCSPFSDNWYSRDNTGSPALISGLRGWCFSFLWCLIVLPKFSFYGGFIAIVAADTFAYLLAVVSCGVSSVVSALYLILLFTLLNATLKLKKFDACAHLIVLLCYGLNHA